MKLYKLDEIESKLEEEFEGIDLEIIEDLLLKKRESEVDIKKLIDFLNIIELPESFVSVVKKYELDNLSMQNVQFGTGSDYIERLIEINSPNQYWYQESRKNNLILIGNSDPFSIFMNLENGIIYAISPEVSFVNKLKIAQGLNHLIQGLGTAFLTKESYEKEELIDFLSKIFGDNSRQFWNQLI